MLFCLVVAIICEPDYFVSPSFAFRTTFSEFAMKHGRDQRFKNIDKMKDREAIFVEFMTAMKKREKEDSKSRGEKVSTQ